MMLNHHACAYKQTSGNLLALPTLAALPTLPALPALPAETVSSTAAQNPQAHAPEFRMT